LAALEYALLLIPLAYQCAYASVSSSQSPTSQRRIEMDRVQKAKKYIDSLSYADTQSYAQLCLYAMLDQRPWPIETNYKITRTMTPAAQYRRACSIRAKLLSILYP
jgi:hypothetical protein